MSKKNQEGSVVGYALVAIFLTGLLIAALSQGARKSSDTTQLDTMMLYLQTDIKTIHAAISECVQTYSRSATANPNTPFPLYGDLSSGGTGDEIADIKCPGAPTPQRVIFTGNMGDRFKALSDTATYTTTYLTDATEGAYIRITRASSDPLWTEAIGRLNTKYSECTAAAVTAVGTCANGCFYYWIIRRATSALTDGEAGCP